MTVRSAFDSTKHSLHIFYVQTVACFLQESLQVPYDTFRQLEVHELLKSCGINLALLHDVGYQKALPERGAAHFRKHESGLRKNFRDLFEAAGQDVVVKDVPG